MKRVSIMIFLVMLFVVVMSGVAFAGATPEEIAGIANDFVAKKISGEDAISKLTKEAENQENTTELRGLAYAKRSWIYSFMGNLAMARKDAEKSISLNSKTVSGYVSLAIVQASENDYTRAKTSMDQALKNLGEPDKGLENLRDLFLQLANAPTATVLHKEFQNNLFAAEEKYKNKQIFFKGVVSGIGRTMNNMPELTITAGQFEEFECELKQNQVAYVSRLNKGNTVYLQCALKKSGEAIVWMENCEVINF